MIHAGLMVLEIALVQSFPVCALSPETAPAEGAAPHSIVEILRSNPRFSFMLLAILFSITALLPLSNFLINILQAKGGGAEQLGLALFLMAASELPGSIIFARLQRRGAGSDRLLVLSLVFSAVKALALFLAPSVGFILLAQPLQMLGYGVFTPASVYFVSESVPPADEVRGQTLMMVASNGLGGVLGSLLAGSALDAGLSAGGRRLLDAPALPALRLHRGRPGVCRPAEALKAHSSACPSIWKKRRNLSDHRRQTHPFLVVLPLPIFAQL